MASCIAACRLSAVENMHDASNGDASLNDQQALVAGMFELQTNQEDMKVGFYENKEKVEEEVKTLFGRHKKVEEEVKTLFGRHEKVEERVTNVEKDMGVKQKALDAMRNEKIWHFLARGYLSFKEVTPKDDRYKTAQFLMKQKKQYDQGGALDYEDIISVLKNFNWGSWEREYASPFGKKETKKGGFIKRSEIEVLMSLIS